MKRLLSLLAAALLASPACLAQPPGRAPALPPREAAPIDLTGYWTAVVTEDWMFRMVTPPKGEYLGVPLNQAGRQAADTWDPERDSREGQACKAYGAAALLRLPGRLQIDWADEATLRLRAEAGEQERHLHFNPPAQMPEPSLQGVSAARWELAAGELKSGKLVVETDNLLPGYLRKNGVPYSADARVNEYYSVYEAPQGDTWLVVTTEVIDSRYLNSSFITSSHFKKLSAEDGQRYWRPEPCSAL